MTFLPNSRKFLRKKKRNLDRLSMNSKAKLKLRLTNLKKDWAVKALQHLLIMILPDLLSL